MNYEEKYKQALERASKLRVQNPFDTVGQMVEHIFPELKESEDGENKRISKEITQFLKQNNGWNREWLAWIEKKGQVKESLISQHEIEVCKENDDSLTSDDERIKETLKEFVKGYSAFINGQWRLGDFTVNRLIAWLEKQKNTLDKEYVFRPLAGDTIEKAAEKAVELDGKVVLAFNGAYISIGNKTKDEIVAEYYDYIKKKQGEHAEVEPKFHEGDWIVLPLGIIAHVDSLNSTDYQVTTTDGKICDFKISKQDNYRLWTIGDAKNGDVLTTKAGGIFIYKELLYNKPFAYCGVDKFGVFKDCNCGNGLDWTPYLSDVTPATKEQRDTLIKAMANAGYTFDFEKKELKKKLDADKVIEWLNDQACLGWIEDIEVDKFIAKFKEDFGL